MDPEPGSRHHRQLTSGQDTWSARCGVIRTPGAEGGPGKPTGSNPGRAPRSDPTTNLPDETDAAQVLVRYKGQEVVERRYSAFKGPLAVAPMFLKTNRRIAALITVICLALLIFCLTERAARNALAPETRMSGLVPGQKAKPTGRLIFQALGGLRLIPATNGQPALIPQPDPVQARLLDLLAVDPTQPP